MNLVKFQNACVLPVYLCSLNVKIFRSLFLNMQYADGFGLKTDKGDSTADL